MSARHEFLRRMTHVMARAGTEQSLASTLCLTVVDVSAARAGAIVVGMEGSAGVEPSVLCSTSSLASRFEEAQQLAREGPSYDVLRWGVAVSVDDVVPLASRWPRFAETLRVAEVASGAFDVLPMRVEDDVVGVLSLHRPPGAALAAPPRDLQFFADIVGAAMVDEMTRADRVSLTWSERDLIAQATGMVVVQLSIDPRDAVAVLRARAFVDRTTLAEISRKVVARSLRFSIDDGEGATQ